jgi:hypothetical protein
MRSVQLIQLLRNGEPLAAGPVDQTGWHRHGGGVSPAMQPSAFDVIVILESDKTTRLRVICNESIAARCAVRGQENEGRPDIDPPGV